MQKQRHRSAVSAFVFATRIVQFLFYLYPKFQASSFVLELYNPVCVEPGRKPKFLVFSCEGSYMFAEDITDLELHVYLINKVV